MSELKFDANGLIPAVVQDYYTKKVLTVAYMNRESLAISIAEKRTCFYSRSRRQLWRKGGDFGQCAAYCLHHHGLRRGRAGGGGEKGRAGLPSGHGQLL